MAMRGDPLTVIVALDENGRASGTYYADDGESYEYASAHSAFGAGRSLSFENNRFAVSAPPRRTEVAVTAKIFTDDSVIERVFGVRLVFHTGATCSTATCAPHCQNRTPHTAAHIRQPNQAISEDFTISVRR